MNINTWQIMAIVSLIILIIGDTVYIALTIKAVRETIIERSKVSIIFSILMVLLTIALIRVTFLISGYVI